MAHHNSNNPPISFVWAVFMTIVLLYIFGESRLHSLLLWCRGPGFKRRLQAQKSRESFIHKVSISSQVAASIRKNGFFEAHWEACLLLKIKKFWLKELPCTKKKKITQHAFWFNSKSTCRFYSYTAIWNHTTEALVKSRHLSFQGHSNDPF